MKKPTKAHATRIVHSDKNYPEKLRLLFWNLGNWIVTNDIKQLVLSRNEERMLHADLMNNPTHAPKLRKMMAAHAAFLPYWNIPPSAVSLFRSSSSFYFLSKYMLILCNAFNIFFC